MSDDRAAGYSPTDRAEDRSVRALENLLDDNLLKTLFNKNSTIPNTDGVLQILENSKTWNPIAIFDVQIKTLTEADLKRNGYNASRELLNYAKDVATNPVLLFVVSADKKLSLWIHLDKKLAKEKIEEMTGDSITVRFPENNKISEASGKEYINEWIEIHAKSIKAIQLFDEREEELEKSRAAAAIINKTGTAISIQGDGKKLQEFSDTLNDLYNREFLSIKDIFYRDAWKIGLGIFDCSQEMLSYTFYPIEFGSSDLLIKKLDQQVAHNLQGIDFVTSHFQSNPIYDSPKGYAYQCISEDVKKSLKLNIYNFSHELLCRETIFGTIENDRFGLLGLDRSKDEYSVDELKFSLNTYLPCYLYVYLSFLISVAPNFSDAIDVQLEKRGFVEIDDLLNLRYHLFTPEGMRVFDEELSKALKEPGKNRIHFPIHSKKLNLRRFSHAISSLSNDSRRPYLRPKSTGRGGWIWSDYTVEDVFQMANTVFKALPDCLHNIVQKNFPLLATELDYFKDFDTLIIKVRESIHTGFVLGIHQIKTNEVSLKRQVIVLPHDDESFKEDRTEWTATFKDIPVEIVSSGWGVHDELFRSFPLSTNISVLLHKRLEEYFKKNGSKVNWGPSNQYQYY